MGRPSWIPASQWSFLVREADQYGTYPEVFAAIGKFETGWGTEGAGRQGYILGVGVPSSTTELSQYQGLAAQVAWTAPRAGRVIDHHASYSAFLTYARTVQKPAKPVPWAQGVWSIYRAIGGPTSGPGPTQPANPSPPATGGSGSGSATTPASPSPSTGGLGAPEWVGVGLVAALMGVLAVRAL